MLLLPALLAYSLTDLGQGPFLAFFGLFRLHFGLINQVERDSKRKANILQVFEEKTHSHRQLVIKTAQFLLKKNFL